MGLTFRRPGTDRGPADQISDVLRNNGIEQFRCSRHPLPGEIQQQSPGPPQTGVDVVGVVEMGVIDQSLPTNRGARLLEIHPHHHLELILQALADRSQALGILPGSLDVMNRAGAHHHQQTLITATEDLLNAPAG